MARVVNAGISGNTTADVLRRLPAVMSRLKTRLNPAIVQIGSNDVYLLTTALDHARAFAATFNPCDLIDEESSFTADNLMALIATAAPPTLEDRVIAQLVDLA